MNRTTAECAADHISTNLRAVPCQHQYWQAYEQTSATYPRSRLLFHSADGSFSALGPFRSQSREQAGRVFLLSPGTSTPRRQPARQLPGRVPRGLLTTHTAVDSHACDDGHRAPLREHTAGCPGKPDSAQDTPRLTGRGTAIVPRACRAPIPAVKKTPDS
jgi:hypothetical protein